MITGDHHHFHHHMKIKMMIIEMIYSHIYNHIGIEWSRTAVETGWMLTGDLAGNLLVES